MVFASWIGIFVLAIAFALCFLCGFKECFGRENVLETIGYLILIGGLLVGDLIKKYVLNEVRRPAQEWMQSYRDLE